MHREIGSHSTRPRRCHAPVARLSCRRPGGRLPSLPV